MVVATVGPVVLILIILLVVLLCGGWGYGHWR